MIRAKVILIPSASFKAELEAAAGRVRDTAAVCKVGANAVANEIKSHFKDLNQRPNAEGWAKSGFWAQVRDSVQVLTDSAAAVVQINDTRFNLKFYGGTVTPKTAKALSIPLHEEFKGVLPSTFPRGRFFFLPDNDGNNVGVLAEALGDGKIRAAYLLRKSTAHAAMPDALPPMERLREIAVEAMKRHILRTA